MKIRSLFTCVYFNSMSLDYNIHLQRNDGKSILKWLQKNELKLRFKENVSMQSGKKL